MPAIVVVGSLNLDLVVPVPHHPRPGETVLGGDHFTNPGGKGANQAVAAARLGCDVVMVGRVGEDDPGRRLVAALSAEGVDVTNVATTPDAPSGVAFISVDSAAENAIIVSPGANARVTAADVEEAGSAVRDASVVLLQLEVPVETTTAAAVAATGTVVLNPAPARDLPEELLGAVDVLVPNRGELGRLAGAEEPTSRAEIVELARRVRGPRALVVTLGAEGAMVVAEDRAEFVPGIKVEAVDTTAAGDSFCGALADGLVRGSSLSDACTWAAAAAALTVTKRGAQSSLPDRSAVKSLLRRRSASGGSQREVGA